MSVVPYLVTPDRLDEARRDVTPLVAFAAARSGGRMRAEDAWERFADGRLQLWVGRNDRGRAQVIVMTTIVEYPRLKACQLVSCVGDDMPDWIALIAEIEAWARVQGCAKVEPWGRPGWKRALAPHGYREIHAIMEKDL